MGRVEVSVLPSPVAISAMRPWWRTMPPIICTSKCRWPSVRRAASRTTANASGRMSSSVSPFARRSRNSAVRARRASSDSAFVPASSALIFTTTFFSRRSSASLESKMRPRTLKGRSLGDRQRHLRSRWIEERADGFALVDTADRLREERGDRQDTHLLVVAHRWRHRAGIRGDELHDTARRETLGGVVAKNAMRAGGPDLIDAALLQDPHRVQLRRATVDLVIDDDRAFAVDVADHSHDLAATAVVAVRLLHEHEWDVQHLADPARLVRIAEVGYDERTLVGGRLHDRAEVLDDQVTRRQLVPRDAEEALDLHLVHVHGEEGIRSRDGDDVREQARGAAHAVLVLLVAPAVGVVGHDRGDAPRRSALERIDHDEQLHDRVAHRGTGEGLDHEHVVFAHVLVDLHEDVVVRELEDLGRSQRDLEGTADVARKRWMSVAGVDGQSPVHGSPSARGE